MPFEPCPNCGKTISPEAKKCPHCKFKLGEAKNGEEPKAAEPKPFERCPSCGKPISTDARKCPHCKYKLREKKKGSGGEDGGGGFTQAFDQGCGCVFGVIAAIVVAFLIYRGLVFGGFWAVTHK